MANDYVKNFVYGNVSVAPSPASSGTSLSMSDADATLFPDPATAGVGAYDVVVWPAGVKPSAANAEIVRITAKAAPSGGNTAFTITRQQQSTSARTIVLGDQIAMNLTAKTITDIIGMGTSSLVRNEVPSGSVNSSNTAFTTAAAFQTGSLRVYQNGIRLKAGGVDFTEGTQGFTMVVAPVTGDTLLVDYETNTSSFATGSTSFINNEIPSGTINGSNTSFTLAYTPVSGSLRIERDGQAIYETDDWTLSGTTLTFVTAPATGSKLRAFYQKSLSVAGNADTLDGYHANATPTASNIPVLDSKAQLPYSDGWTPAGETFVYASATTVTISGDLTTKYYKGMKIKLTQSTGGTKYFVIATDSSYGAPNTTLTLHPYDGSTTLANETITTPYYSRDEVPAGFPSKPKLSAYLNSAQDNITDNSTTLVNIDTEIFDIGSNFNTTSHLFTAPVTGYYRIIGNVGWKSGTTVDQKPFVVAIFVDSTTQADQWTQASGTGAVIQNISVMSLVSKGSTISVRAYHNVGGNTPDLYNNYQYTFLMIEFIGV